MQTDHRMQTLNDLDHHQIRVLGCLAEKQLAAPKSYPSTLQAMLQACNQELSRSPVMHLDEGQIQRALVSLRLLGLVHVDLSGRQPRYSHLLNRHLALELPQFAILTALLLRGPLSPAEIIKETRSMYVFTDVAGVESALMSSQLFEPSLRMNGQRSERYRHTLGTRHKMPPTIRSTRNQSPDATLASTPAAKLSREFRSNPLQSAMPVHKEPSTTLGNVVDELRQLQTLLDLTPKEATAPTNPVRSKDTSNF